MALAFTVVSLMGIALVVTGSIYWARKEAMNSDPVLIVSCLGSGVVLLASSAISLAS